MKIDYIGIICKGHHKVCDGRTDIADHNTTDDQHGHVVDFFATRSTKPMEIIEPAKAARIMAPEPMDTDLLKKDHQKRHDQLGTGRDSQYKGSRDRIVKKVCSKNPETESAPPRMITASILGRRISQTIL